MRALARTIPLGSMIVASCYAAPMPLPAVAAPAASISYTCMKCKRLPKSGWKSCAYCGASLGARLKVVTLGVPAEIWVDGTKWGRTGEVLAGIPFGKHQVSVISRTHLRADRIVEFTPGKLEPLTVSLVALPGSILLETNAPNAAAYVDGKLRGNAGSPVEDVTPGRHVVEARAVGFHPAAQTVIVKSGVNSRVKLELTSASGAIHISDTGFPDEVFLDGEARGTSPLVLTDVPEGAHLLEIRITGRPAILRRIHVEGGQIKRIDPRLIILTKVTHVPERLEITPGGYAAVTYTFTYPEEVETLRTRTATFETPTGDRISDTVGPYSNQYQLPASGAFKWSDRVLLPLPVAQKARELGLDVVHLRQVFYGARLGGASITWEVSVPIKIR